MWFQHYVARSQREHFGKIHSKILKSKTLCILGHKYTHFKHLLQVYFLLEVSVISLHTTSNKRLQINVSKNKWCFINQKPLPYELLVIKAFFFIWSILLHYTPLTPCFKYSQYFSNSLSELFKIWQLEVVLTIILYSTIQKDHVVVNRIKKDQQSTAGIYIYFTKDTRGDKSSKWIQRQFVILLLLGFHFKNMFHMLLAHFLTSKPSIKLLCLFTLFIVRR